MVTVYGAKQVLSFRTNSVSRMRQLQAFFHSVRKLKIQYIHLE